MASEKDDLEAFIEECAKEDPNFPALVDAALQRRQAARARGEDPNDSSLEEGEAEDHPAISPAKP